MQLASGLQTAPGSTAECNHKVTSSRVKLLSSITQELLGRFCSNFDTIFPKASCVFSAPSVLVLAGLTSVAYPRTWDKASLQGR